MKRTTSVILSLGLALGLAAGAAGTAQAFDVSELQVNIWDNNQLAGLQKIADGRQTEYR